MDSLIDKIQIKCIECSSMVNFSLSNLFSEHPGSVFCSCCGTKYSLNKHESDKAINHLKESLSTLSSHIN